MGERPAGSCEATTELFILLSPNSLRVCKTRGALTDQVTGSSRFVGLAISVSFAALCVGLGCDVELDGLARFPLPMHFLKKGATPSASGASIETITQLGGYSRLLSIEKRLQFTKCDMEAKADFAIFIATLGCGHVSRSTISRKSESNR